MTHPSESRPGNMSHRKMIQLAVASDNTTPDRLYGLADDGSIWLLKAADHDSRAPWEKIAPPLTFDQQRGPHV